MNDGVKLFLGFFLLSEAIAMTSKTDTAYFTILLRRNNEECFFTHSLKLNQILMMDYVPMSRTGDPTEESNVLVVVRNPHGLVLQKDNLTKNDGYVIIDHEFEFLIRTEGEHQICLKNINTWTDLNVFFEMYIKNNIPTDANSTINDFDDYDEIAEAERQKMIDYDLSHESDYHMKVNDIRHFIMNIHNSVESISFYQSLTQATYNRDHQVAYFLSEKVRFYSLFLIIILLGVGAIQVVMVKSLFDEKNMFHKYFK